jgi:hypothetical protein
MQISLPQTLVSALGDECRTRTDYKRSHPLPRVLLNELKLRSDTSDACLGTARFEKIRVFSGLLQSKKEALPGKLRTVEDQQ